MRVGLRNHQALLLHGGEVPRLADDLAVLHQTIRRFDETVLVHLGEGGQAVDQPDIRSFRRLDRADAAIMGRMHVAHLEARALPRQTAWPKRAQAPLMRHFRQRIGLVHELAELARAEELTDRSCRRLGVDQVVRHHGIDIDRAHALLDGALHPQQPQAILVLHELAHRTHPAVAQVVDVVDRALAVLQLLQGLHRCHDVLLAQGAHRVRRVLEGEAQAHVHLHPANAGQVVALIVKEQAAEQVLGSVRRRRLARAHDPVDVHQRFFAVGVLVHLQGVADPRAHALVDGQGGQRVDAGLLHRRQLRLGKLLASLDPDLAGLKVHDVLGHEAAQQIGAADQHLGGAGLEDLLRGARGHLHVFFRDDRAGLGVDQRLQQLDAAEAVRIEIARPTLGQTVERHLAVEMRQDLLGIHAAHLARLQLAALGTGGDTLGFGGSAVERV